MASACAVSVAGAAPSSPAGKRGRNSPPRRSFPQCRDLRRRPRHRGVAARFSRDTADAEAEADSGRIEDDSSYLWKLGIGSVGGAAAIKYGSILLPDITRPGIVQALVMVFVPVAVAALLLFKESSRED
ncbi:hypothetical protein GUJ93_ZPchr0006g44520 [Zizania palustris]|uniref:Uncharacterized protein n=1 Tax=Zizania palustris TaxID=103762 RepID=A0A8J5T2W0_ZIZPA|nr:hypothetical protein GUJ93_ZPchr0006g44520 [Zizania palustris]